MTGADPDRALPELSAISDQELLALWDAGHDGEGEATDRLLLDEIERRGLDT